MLQYTDYSDNILIIVTLYRLYYTLVMLQYTDYSDFIQTLLYAGNVTIY